MSDFHGGFLVRAIEATAAERIRLVLARQLGLRRIDPARHAATFAARRGCPVMHVAVRGPAADGKDAAYFHLQHGDLGAAVARAAGAPVWAYHFENQVGTECVRAFGPDGRERSYTYCRWDDLEAQIVDEAGGARRVSAFHAAPLGVLAAELGVARETLAMDLAYGTPNVRVDLIGADCTAVVAAYLAERVPAVSAAPLPEVATSVLDHVQSVYVPTWMAAELERIAGRLGTSVGTIVWAAWEAAKQGLHGAFPMQPDLDAPVGPPRYLPAPRSEPPAAIVVPAAVPLGARVLAHPPAHADKIKLTVALPARVVDEVQAFAFALDRSLSWVVQQAFMQARGRLHAASAVAATGQSGATASAGSGELRAR